MSSITDVRHVITGMIGRLYQDAGGAIVSAAQDIEQGAGKLHTSEEQIEQAIARLRAVTEGSSDGDLASAIASLETQLEQVREVYHRIAPVPNELEGITGGIRDAGHHAEHYAARL